jgi:hypothetical protein
LISGGCNAARSHLNVFNGYFETADYENSVVFAEKKISGKDEPRGEDLLWTLQLGCVQRMRGDYRKSTEYLDKSEEMLKYFDLKNELGDVVGSTLANDNIVPYKGQEYDGVMVNVYKALNFMTEGRRDLARVEFNRALDRQRRAKEKYNREINKLKDETEKGQQQNEFTKSNVENADIQKMLAERYPNLYEFEAYPDFVNPFATYLAGVFFYLDADYSKAADLLKESHGMVPDNAYIAGDLTITERILDGKARAEPTVWVIFENGLGPVKEEFRLDIPLFVATNNIKYVGIALPKLKFRNAAYPYLVIKADGRDYRTAQVADMDRVVQTEFKKDFQAILTRAIISATAKAVAQYALSEQNSSGAAFASILVAAYSYATTAADVRIWTTLPKDFQIARLARPADGKLLIIPPGSVGFEAEVSGCNSAIVYVRITKQQARPVVDVIRF